MSRRIIIPGGTGQIGQILTRAFAAKGDRVTILTRSMPPRADFPAAPGPNIRYLPWDARTLGGWTHELEGADAVINLAGRSVNCRYHEENRRAIIDSRVDSTRAIRRAIAAADQPPKVWLQASTATIYSHRFDAPNDETTGILDPATPDAPDTWRFSIDVARRWEAAALDGPPLPATRTVLMRSSIVLSPDPGGVFSTLLALVRLGLGGAVGNGRQYISWLHEADLIVAVEHLLASDHLSGPVILAAPGPLPNAAFMRELRRAWGMPIGLPAPWPLIEIGTWLMRTESELVLKSRRVIPGRLLADGFTFRYPDWAQAAQELCERVRQQQR